MPDYVTALPTALAERKLRTLRAHPQVTGAWVGLIKAASPQAGQESRRLQGTPEGEDLPPKKNKLDQPYFYSQKHLWEGEN